MSQQQRKTKIRQTINQRRRTLDVEFQLQAAQKICQHLLTLDCIQQATTIALYCAAHGEADPFAITEHTYANEKTWVLPTLTETNQLAFFPFQKEEPLQLNKYGILEPSNLQTPIKLEQIDVALIPLVAFDQQGNRLGRGKGYYDKTFAKINRNSVKLIGVAYDFQRIDPLPIDAWDVPLNKIITERKIYNNKEPK